jgi:2-methylcitrate dehydratase PrpD
VASVKHRIATIGLLLAGCFPDLALARNIAQNCVAAPLGETDERTIANQLGAAVAASRFEDMTPAVVERTKLTVLDNIATLAFTSQLMRNHAFLRRARDRRGQTEARLWGNGISVPVEEAAAVNAWLIHAAETDDSDFRASLRASPVIMAPALAVAEARHASGREFLTSLAVGYTVLGRLAAPLGPLQLNGYMSSGVWGPPAAAAVSARLMRLAAPQTANAIAIAGSASGGSFQYFYDQTEEKRLIVSRAARSGVEAAMLACAGERGAAHIFEGQAGLYRLFGGATATIPTADQITEGFEHLEGPLRLYPKFSAASASIIPFLEALDPIRRERNLTVADIDHFTLRGNADAAKIYAAKLAHYVPPSTEIGAKTSLAFVVSLYLARGSADAYDFTVQSLTDPAINTFAAKGQFESLDSPATTLTLVLKTGETINVTPYQSTGATDEPIMRDARMAKFRSLTRDAMTDAERAKVIALVDSLDGVQDMAVWARQIDALISRHHQH